MDLDTSRPFRGSQAVGEGRTTWTVLGGPRFRWLAPDTYVDAAVTPDARLRVLAALVHAGEGSVATGWSAVLLHGLDVAPREMPLEVAQPFRHLRGPGATVRRQRFPPGEVVDVDGERATSPLRTAFDLATRSGRADALVAADALGRLGGSPGSTWRRSRSGIPELAVSAASRRWPT